MGVGIYTSADEVGPLTLLIPGCMDSGGFSRLYVLELPSHILSQGPHGLQSLLVLKHILRGKAVHLVPILGADYSHVGDGEIHIQRLESHRCPAPAAGDHRCSQLAGKFIEGALEQPVQKTFELAADPAVVDRRTHHNTIEFIQPLVDLIDHVTKHAGTGIAAFPAAQTAAAIKSTAFFAFPIIKLLLLPLHSRRHKRPQTVLESQPVPARPTHIPL